jgi:hypothetical protein
MGGIIVFLLQGTLINEQFTAGIYGILKNLIIYLYIVWTFLRYSL